MNFIGIDPDCNTPAVACVDEQGKLQWVNILRGGHGALGISLGVFDFTIPEFGFTAAAVEAQEVYLKGKGRTKNPRDIVALAQVAGVMVAWLAMHRTVYGKDSPCEIMMPLPVQWKGNVPKHIHHRRILAKAGIDEKFLVPMGGNDPYLAVSEDALIRNSGKIILSDWKHLTDAVGLAQYAAEKFTAQRAMDSARGIKQ